MTQQQIDDEMKRPHSCNFSGSFKSKIFIYCRKKTETFHSFSTMESKLESEILAFVRNIPENIIKDSAIGERHGNCELNSVDYKNYLVFEFNPPLSHPQLLGLSKLESLAQLINSKHVRYDFTNCKTLYPMSGNPVEIRKSGVADGCIYGDDIKENAFRRINIEYIKENRFCNLDKSPIQDTNVYFVIQSMHIGMQKIHWISDM